MCSVWKRKSQKQLTPQELATILDNSLFRELKYIGVSGGEPTLREDLAEIFQVIVSRKGLQRTGIITNAIEADSVINQLDKCYHICRKANVPFNVMVSLDGVGKIHEIVRGKKGSFEQAIKVIRHLRDNTDIPLTVACTVIKENVWNIDEVLAFCKKENVYVRFRVAEYIDRLYNEDCKRSIRNFDDDERYQIALFFSKLELSYEKSRNIIETYKNIRKMVYDDSPRQSGCPYQKNAICLDSVGNLLFCSPKSPIIGSCLEQSAKKIYIKNIHLQDEIINRYCPNCIHDYHAPPTKESLKKEKERNNFRRQMRIKESLSDSKSFSINSPFLSDWSTFKKSFIIGWYGTETAGDKPILASIVKKIKDSNPEAEISVSSLYPFITRRTLYELGLTDLRIVNTFSPAYLETCRIADAIIMGGGPLMNIESLGIVLTAFKEGCKRGIPTIIEGCGIGPLSSEKHRLAVKEILRLSTEIKVRDTASLAWVIENTGRTDATYTPDPAVSFVEDWKKMNLFHLKEQKKDYFGCFFREITPEYAGEMTPTDFWDYKIRFEKQLGGMIRFIIEETGLKALFMPMHTFVIGGDDRDFARRLTKTYLPDSSYNIGNRIYSLQDLLSTMSQMKFNICMRFHSVLFSHTLGVPFIAIDYTNGGKIYSFLRDHDNLQCILSRDSILDKKINQVINYIFNFLN